MERSSFLPAWAERHAAAVAATLALIVFLPSLRGGFLYDDFHLIVENRAIRHLSNLGLVLAYEPSRPLLNLTWAVNYAISGTTPWPYHLINILIHAGNAALVASLFLFLAQRGKGFLSTSGACLGAWLFAVNPMATETVAYVASRSSALATLFGLAALRMAVTALDTRRPRLLGGALAFFVLAAATKEEAASVPLFLLLLDYFFLAGQRGREVQSRILWHLPFFAIVVAGLVGRGLVTGTFLPAGDSAATRGEYLWTQWTAFPAYLAHALVPLDPALYRGYPIASWPPVLADGLRALLTAALLAVALRGRRLWPMVGLAILWLGAGLLPSSSLVPLTEMVVDHRAYFGSLGVTILLGHLLARTRSAEAAAVVLVVLAAVSLRYERVLADPVRVWQDAAARAPHSALPQIGLAEAYAASGDPRVEEALVRAVELEPRNAQALASIGVFYIEQGRYEQATAALRAAARAAPRDARIQNNLGLLLWRSGKPEEAILALEAAMAADPGLAQPRLDLADLLLSRGQFARARALVEEAARLEIDPGDAEAIERLRRRLP